MKNLLILFIGLVLSAPSFGQGGEKDYRKAIESYRIAYMTQHLQLTPQEAEKFWPVYNQMQSELKVLHIEKQKTINEFKSSGKENSIADYELEMKQRELDIVKKHHTSLKQALPEQKVAKLYNTEKDFRNELKQRIQEHREQNGVRNNNGPKVRNEMPPRAKPGSPSTVRPSHSPNSRPAPPTHAPVRKAPNNR